MNAKEGVSLSMGSLAGSYNTLVDAIIRPPRFRYEQDDMGPKQFRMGKKSYERTDFEVTNQRGMKIQASHYEPIPSQRKGPLPCVIYLHGNCGSRLDALDCLSILLPYNITLVSFDFTGSGLSDGEYVSLGYFEKDDLQTVVEYLRSTGTVTKIGLWGRSMGAATSILYGATDPSIACMVLDSPFSSLTKVAKELVETAQFKIPKMMVSLGLRMIRKTIISKAKFDINKLEPIEAVESCFIPVLLAHGESDTFIGPHHARELYEKYAGDKNLILVEGDHNSARPQFFYDSVSIFFHNMLLSGEDFEVKNDEEEQTSEVLYRARASSKDVRRHDFPYEPSIEELEEEMLRQALYLSLHENGSTETEERESTETSSAEQPPAEGQDTQNQKPKID
jgi:pimeloyl-ACP methyl ester carboxylesterase